MPPRSCASLPQVSPESQLLQFEIYFKRFGKLAGKCRGSRAKLRPSMEEWRQESARCALFCWVMNQMKSNLIVSDQLAEQRAQQFADGPKFKIMSPSSSSVPRLCQHAFLLQSFARPPDRDFNDEIEGWLHVQPEDWDPKKTTIWGSACSDVLSTSAIVDLEGGDIAAASEEAEAKWFEVTKKKIVADWKSWSEHMQNYRDEMRSKSVANVIHGRAMNQLGNNVAENWSKTFQRVVHTREPDAFAKIAQQAVFAGGG